MTKNSFVAEATFKKRKHIKHLLTLYFLSGLENDSKASILSIYLIRDVCYK